MPTVEELLKWHKDSRMEEITAADTMEDAFRIFAEANGLDQDDPVLKFVWSIACTYMASRAIRAMRKRVKPTTFAEALTKEMIDRIKSHPMFHTN